MALTEKEKKEKLKIQKRFGEHIKKLRKEKGLSAAEFGRLCFMERSNVAKLDRGDLNPTLYTLITLAKALDTSLHGLLQGFE